MTADEMKSLGYGDKVHFRVGGEVVLTPENLNNNGSDSYPIRIKIYDGWYSFTLNGSVYEGKQDPLDIISITKAPEIPAGFVRWDSSSWPPDVNSGDKVDIITKQSGLLIDNHLANYVIWRDIRGYRLIPPKQRGELWAVIVKSEEINARHIDLFPSQQEATDYAKITAHKPLAIKSLNITWEQGEGLELVEGTYPCTKCGTLRTKAEGGETFTLCDKCWDEEHTARGEKG